MLLSWADDILCATPETSEERSGSVGAFQMLAVLCVYGILYGGVMGSYAGGFGGRSVQLLYSGV